MNDDDIKASDAEDIAPIAESARIAELEKQLYESQMFVLGYQQQCADLTMQMVQLRIALTQATDE